MTNAEIHAALELALACPDGKSKTWPEIEALLLPVLASLRSAPPQEGMREALEPPETPLQSADYGQQPDHDGDNGKGFIVTNGDFWGHCEASHYSVIMVKPDWQMYGK